MTVAELKAELDRLGVEYPGNARKPELTSLLANAQETIESEPVGLLEEDFEVDAPTEEVEEVLNTDTGDKKMTGVSIYDEHGKYVRTYCEEIHGKDYKKLADQFIAKRPSHIIK